jgi:hypothetical protein
MLTVTPDPEYQGLFTVSDDAFTAKVQTVSAPSPDWGLLGGRIIKLTIYESHTEVPVFGYDRGFDHDGMGIAERHFLNAVVNHFDGVRVHPQGEGHA